MRNVINLVLVSFSLIIVYLLYSSVKEPILFAEEKNKRKNAVVGVLKQIQVSQDVYRMVKGRYADNFDSLFTVIKQANVAVIKLEVDPSEPNNQDKFIQIVTFKRAIDTLENILGRHINIDSLRYVPFSKGKTFLIDADTITYQNTTVNVVEISTKYRDFMGRYADKKYSKYDHTYDPDQQVKFGDMSTPNLNGNW